MSAPAPTVSAELRALLRKVKLGRSLDTLPERLALAKSRSMGHAEFLELILADEVTRRDTHSADLRARTAGLDPAMRFENWDDTAKITYDHAVLDELVSLRFIQAAHNALILGPVGAESPSWRPPSGTPPSAGATACTSNGETNSSSGSRLPGSTTATTSSSASYCASTC
jgi:hypothetical protein